MAKRFGGSTPGQLSREHRRAGTRLVGEDRNVALKGEWAAQGDAFPHLEPRRDRDVRSVQRKHPQWKQSGVADTVHRSAIALCTLREPIRGRKIDGRSRRTTEVRRAVIEPERTTQHGREPREIYVEAAAGDVKFPWLVRKRDSSGSYAEWVRSRRAAAEQNQYDRGAKRKLHFSTPETSEVTNPKDSLCCARER